MKLKRFDKGEIKSSIKTPEGFLKVDAIVTRTGILDYLNPDGSLRKELRHPDDVFLQDSLDTLKMIPVTKLHPAEKRVDSENAKMLSVGFTGENPRPDGKYIRLNFVVTDQSAIDSVENGLREISLGYDLISVSGPGEYDGARWDFRQTEIEYNHLAIVPSARAGQSARIVLDSDGNMRLDSEMTQEIIVNFDKETSKAKVFEGDSEFKGKDHIHTYIIDSNGDGKTSASGKHEHRIYDFHVTWNEGHFHDLLNIPQLNKDSNKQKRSDNMDMVKVRLDGDLSYDAAPEVANFLQKETARADQVAFDLGVANEKSSKLQANLDQANEELKALKGKNIDADISKGVQERLSLIRASESHLDEETNKSINKMSDKDIKLAVIKSGFPEANMDGKDEAYINARYDGVIEMGVKSESAMSSQRKAANQDKAGSGNNADEAEKRYQDDLTNAWKTKG